MDGTPNEQPIIKIGILGLGIAGNSMIPAILKHPHVKLTAAATRNQKRLDLFQETYGGEIYTSLEEMCQSDAVDVIYIATPTELHMEHVLTAVNHKKHVIVEKPLAISSDACDEMIEAAERNGVKMIVGHSHSFEPPIRKMREVIQSGELGRLKMIHNLYFNDWLYRPRTPEELDTELGGGVTFRQGSHQFDIIRYLGGGMVRSVRAVTGAWDDERPTEGSHTIFIEFENGTVATAIYNGYDHFHSTELTFGIGEGGPVAVAGEYAKSRKTVKALNSAEDEVKLKQEAGYGGSRVKKEDGEAHHPFFGLTLVSCEKGDIRQGPNGIIVYGEEEKYEISLPKDETGRDHVIEEMVQAITENQAPIHDGKWAKANLELSLASLQSSRERKEMYLSHQVPVVDRKQVIKG